MVREPVSEAFRGRTVAITGAASGIGLALARRFARGGARLGLLDLDGAGAERAAAEARALGAEAVAMACDVARPEACGAAMERIAADLDGIDALVNNAGITHRSAFADTDAAVLRRVMDVNFFGAVHCTQAALPALVRRRGRIVVVSSVAGFAPLLWRAGYAASKHALHGFFDSLRAELEPDGISVTIACPSFTGTGMEGNALGATLSGARPRVPWSPVGRVAAPEDVAAAIYEGAAARRRLVVLSPVGKAAWWLSRLWPGAYARIMARSQRAAAAEAR